MTSFAYSTGNPANLTGGAGAAMIDIQGPFNDLRTFINGANLSDTQLVSPNNGAWQSIKECYGQVTTQAGGLYVIYQSAIALHGVNTSSHPMVQYMPVAADVAVAGMTTRLRVRVVLSVNSVAPAISYTFGLWPVTSITGGGGQIAYTLGATPTATALLISPSVNTNTVFSSASFDLSALTPGTLYVPAVILSATQTAGCMTAFQWALEQRWT